MTAAITMEELVPISKEIIDDLYPAEAVDAQRKRWARLKHRFHDLYGDISIDFISRSPGRVNLIGEHVDYSLYEVLPMAIAADILLAVSASPLHPNIEKEPRISIASVHSEKFPSAEFSFLADGEADIDASIHSWTNYFKAGLNGALLLLRNHNPKINVRNMQVLVDGTIPAGAGLSSSAAFVCASILAVLCANGVKHISKRELVEVAIVSERSVGVNSGGMDQAASVLSTRGQALSVSFSPLRAKPIPFPPLDPPITFIIAQSFVAADKHVTAPECYNLRVVECTLAAEVMAASLNLSLESDSSPLNHSLHGVHKAYFATTIPLPTLKSQLETMLDMARLHLRQTEGYSLHEIASILSTPAPALLERLTSRFPIRATTFHLARRADHVFSEALRVLQFKSLLQRQPPLPASGLLPLLGTLMSQSQTSCRMTYDCSCPELDQLCEIARSAGAYGSRLTGAGWGGCTVHLVPRGKVDTIRTALEEEYYRVREPNISPERLAEAVIVSEPGQGSWM